MSPSLTLTRKSAPAPGTEQPASNASIPLVSFDLLAGSYRKEKSNANFNFLITTAAILIVVIVAGYGLLQQLKVNTINSQTASITIQTAQATTNIGRLYKVSNPQAYQTYVQSIHKQLTAVAQAQPDSASVISAIAGAASTVPGVSLTSITIGDLNPKATAPTTAGATTPATAQSGGASAPTTLAPNSVTIIGTADSYAAYTQWVAAVGQLTFMTGTQNPNFSGPSTAIAFTTPGTLSPTYTAKALNGLVAQLAVGT
jgi:hypothetical protein